MFHFSFLEFIKYELIVNQKINNVLAIKKNDGTDAARITKISKIVESIVSGYVMSAGLSASFVKLRAVYQAEKKRVADLEAILGAGELCFFGAKTRSDEGYGLYLELMNHITRFAKLLASSPEEKLTLKQISLLIEWSGISSEMHSTLMHIYNYVEHRFYRSMNSLMNFHEYLSDMGMSIEQAGRVDLFQYLKHLESHLAQYTIPVKGDTHFKKTALEVIEEIAKIRNKLRDDEEQVLQVEIEKMRSLQFYLLAHVEGRVLTDQYRPIANEHIRRVVEHDFDSGWSYVNNAGFLSGYSTLLSNLQCKMDFLSKILRDKPEFDSVVHMIDDARAKTQAERSSFILYRYVSAGEFESIKLNGCFTQDSRYSTSENAKWFFYGNGKPGVTNEYFCEVVCGSTAGELINTALDYPNAILVKDNEPDCVGIHEEVLAHFNLLISTIKITHVQSKKSIEIKPDHAAIPTQALVMSLPEAPNSSLYFAMPSGH